MSILIKGLEMPYGCLDCKLHSCGSINEWEVFCDMTGNMVGFWDDKKWNNGWRSSKCPLVEIPAHGDLVDIDEVYRALTAYYHHSTETQHTALREALSRVPIIAEGEDE